MKITVGEAEKVKEPEDNFAVRLQLTMAWGILILWIRAEMNEGFLVLLLPKTDKGPAHTHSNFATAAVPVLGPSLTSRYVG